MHLKKFILGGIIFGLTLSLVYATKIVAPNIIGSLSGTTSINPTTYYLMVQSGSTSTNIDQKAISATNFALSISGYYGLTGFVPYTGATQDVYIRPYSLYTNNAYLTLGGNGIVWTAGGLYAAIGGMGEGTFYVANTNTGVILDVNQLTQDRTISFPDATGTILLDNTLASYLSLGIGTGYIPYRTGTSFANSSMLYSGGNIGINMTNPLYTLSLSGTTFYRNYDASRQGGFNENILGLGVAIRGGALGVTGAAIYGQSDSGYAIVGETITTQGTAGLFRVPSGGTAIYSEGAVRVKSTSFFYFNTGTTDQTGDRRIGLSGGNLSFQYYSGGVWAEKGQFTP